MTPQECFYFSIWGKGYSILDMGWRESLSCIFLQHSKLPSTFSLRKSLCFFQVPRTLEMLHLWSLGFILIFILALMHRITLSSTRKLQVSGSEKGQRFIFGILKHCIDCLLAARYSKTRSQKYFKLQRIKVLPCFTGIESYCVVNV